MDRPGTFGELKALFETREPTKDSPPALMNEPASASAEQGMPPGDGAPPPESSSTG